MPLITPVTSLSDQLDVTAVSAQFATIDDMAASRYYRYCCTVPSWIAQGADPTASAAAGSMFADAGEVIVLDGALGVKLAAIREGGSDGTATLTPLKVV